MTNNTKLRNRLSGVYELNVLKTRFSPSFRFNPIQRGSSSFPSYSGVCSGLAGKANSNWGYLGVIQGLWKSIWKLLNYTGHYGILKHITLNPKP